MVETLLDLPLDARPDPDEFVRAAMDWHFNPETGSAYWLQRAKTLGFDPRADVKSIDDLALFPNIINELRDVRTEDLIPQGYGAKPRHRGCMTAVAPRAPRSEWSCCATGGTGTRCGPT